MITKPPRCKLILVTVKLTIRSCVQEIEQCQKLSIGPNFITFLSQRYGYRPFPATIESAEFEQLLGAAEKKAKSALTKWFKKDENYATPVYKLQAVSSLLPDFLKEGKKRDKAKAKWWDDFSLMSTGLREAALKVCSRLVVSTSSSLHCADAARRPSAEVCVFRD